MPDLAVVAANLHNEKAAVRWLAQRSRPDAPEHYDVALVSEAHKRRRSLRLMPGHTYVTGPEPGPSQETGILLTNGWPIHGHNWQRVSEEIPRFSSVGKERHGRDVLTEISDLPTALQVLHPVAGPETLQHGPPSHALVKAYSEAIAWLDASISGHKAQGHAIVGGGDMQMLAGWDQLWNPIHVFRAHDLAWFWRGLDVVWWSRDFELADSREYQKRTEFPSDHPALRVELSVVRNRRRRR